jgi:hypothetical protein
VTPRRQNPFHTTNVDFGLRDTIVAKKKTLRRVESASFPAVPLDGWSPYFWGYIDRSWVDSQERYHWELGLFKPQYTGNQWASKLIRFQWQAAHEAWLQRRKELHAEEEGIQMALEMQEPQTKISGSAERNPRCT